MAEKKSSQGEHSRSSDPGVALIPVGIALNLSIGTLVRSLDLPVYLDAIGTIILTISCGLRIGVATGILSFLVGGLVNPVLPWFIGSQAAVAVFVHWAARHGFYRTMLSSALAGVVLGAVAGVVSAPVVVAVFGGLTGSGASLIIAFLLATGRSLLKSVVLSGLATEPLDKTVQTLLAVWVIRGVPKSLLRQLPSGSLEKNGLT